MEAWLEHHEWVLLLLLAAESLYWIWRVRRIKKRYQYNSVKELSTVERAVIIDALDTYTQIIATHPEAYRYELYEIADFLKGVDNLKEKFNV